MRTHQAHHRTFNSGYYLDIRRGWPMITILEFQYDEADRRLATDSVSTGQRPLKGKNLPLPAGELPLQISLAIGEHSR